MSAPRAQGSVEPSGVPRKRLGGSALHNRGTRFNWCVHEVTDGPLLVSSLVRVDVHAPRHSLAALRATSALVVMMRGPEQ